MPINCDAVGFESEPFERSWDSTTSLLYALGVGAGTGELNFTTENTAGVAQQAVPTMAVILHGGMESAMAALGPVNWAAMVHGGQALTLHEPLPVAGRLQAVTRIAGIYDKSSAALVIFEMEATDATSGKGLFTSRSTLFLRGEGGFGGDRGPSATAGPTPDGDPDIIVTYGTHQDQALLYRLSGDRNPLHSDPALAAKAGFDRPILHGLCTYGFTARALIAAVCDGDPTRFASIDGRFSAPVLPGEDLTVRIWHTGDGARFQTVTSSRNVAIDAGTFRLAAT